MDCSRCNAVFTLIDGPMLRRHARMFLSGIQFDKHSGFPLQACGNDSAVYQTEIHASEARERGFTLIEVIVVLGIVSVVTSITLMILYQLLIVPAQGNARLAIDADFRTANLWLMHDGNESQSFTPGGTCGVFYTGAARNVSYTYSYSAADHALNRADNSTGQTIAVAHHVAAAPSCTLHGQTVVVVLSSTSGSLSDNTTVTVALRVK